jgi:hypothetical protein
VVTYADLCTLSSRFVTNPGVAQSNNLCAQLSAAQSSASLGNLTAKANQIAAYDSAVDAMVNARFMSPSNAAILKKWAAAL